MIKVMVCDDLAEIRRHFARVIAGEDDMMLVAEAASGKEAVELAAIHKPDIILMDVQMETEDAGITATKEIVEKIPKTKVIILTIYNNDEIVIDAYVAGAVDYIIKESSKDELCNSIRKVYENEDFLGTRIIRETRKRLKESMKKEQSLLYFVNNISKLTATERKIIKYLYDGKRRKMIADIECVSEESVKWHIRNILRKLNFATTAEMVAFLKQADIFMDFDIWK